MQVCGFKGADILVEELANETEEIIGYWCFDSDMIGQSFTDGNITTYYLAKEDPKIKASLRLIPL
ncbi:transposase [Kozakia baliensis NRIC 0488]|uniref:Uncharacterized protein n=1 Tax=Kozakia baliensis TaxID=153496 RepID=A0A1D8USS1_9PROT|nr:hypothetical protein A0U89_05570 [Kozakia baliensis]GBR25885.1 transposase [Kozakia baliensis NRIC 0488]